MDELKALQETIKIYNGKLIAVSKMKSIEDIKRIYDFGIRDFGENRVQELREKQGQLPQDIRWHLIGHLQHNKVKYLAGYIHCIHSVDSLKLLKSIDSGGKKHNRIIKVLLQIKIAMEETKFGLTRDQAIDLLDLSHTGEFPNVCIEGFMGMASFVSDKNQVRHEFMNLKNFIDDMNDRYKQSSLIFKELSMGMSGDYKIALEEGSTMVRIGTLIFGARS